jgi:trehalose 6-phosphate phosphatase
MPELMELERPEIESPESEPPEPNVPEELSTVSPELSSFFPSVAAASESMLLLDFDGTLAPFRVDPSKVRPWTGVTDLLNSIQEIGRTRLAILTGRPALEVSERIALHTPLEIWGLHGAERLFSNGQMEEDELLPEQQEALDAARNKIHATHLKLGLRIEEKRNSIAFHWRGKSRHSILSARQQTGELLHPFTRVTGMQLLEFDGGIELRAGHNKGDAVRSLLNESQSDTPVAYLGDDSTDEDAFRALAGRGLGVLVRRDWRPTAAQAWLRPPQQLRRFLATWLQMLQPVGRLTQSRDVSL